MIRYHVTLTVVDMDGIRPFELEVDAPSHFEAESEAHLIVTHGEGMTVLTVDSVTEAVGS